MAYLSATTRLGPGGGPRAQYVGFAASASAAITGTAASGLTEAQIVAGGETIIITLTADTWLAAGTGPVGSTANTQAIIDGITSAQSELLGWNNEVRDKELTASVVRDSNTQITITLTAASAYDVTANETITATVPAQAIAGASAVIAAPTITVTAAAAVETPSRRGGRTKKQKRYIVDVDGKLFEVATIAEAESVLQQVRDLAQVSADTEVTTPVTPKPPRVSIKTISGNKTTSQTLQREVKKTQRVINRAYTNAARAVARDTEISELLIKKINDEDEEDAILALLL